MVSPVQTSQILHCTKHYQTVHVQHIWRTLHGDEQMMVFGGQPTVTMILVSPTSCFSIKACGQCWLRNKAKLAKLTVDVLTRFQHLCMRVYTSSGQFPGLSRRWPSSSYGRNVSLVPSLYYCMLHIPCLSPLGCVGSGMGSGPLTIAPILESLECK